MQRFPKIAISVGLALGMLIAIPGTTPVTASPVITYRTDLGLYSNSASAQAELLNVQKVLQTAIKEYKSGNKKVLPQVIITNRRMPTLTTTVKGKTASYRSYEVNGSYYLVNETYSITARAYTHKTWCGRLYNIKPSYKIAAHWDYNFIEYTVTNRKVKPFVSHTGAVDYEHLSHSLSQCGNAE